MIGVGNPVRGDDAVGLHVARGVRARVGVDAGCDVAELWAGGLRLVEAISGYDRAVVVDAMAGAEPPGTLRRMTVDDLGACRNVTCVHDVSLSTALELWRRAGVAVPARITVFGIQALEMSTLSERLTAPVAGAIPGAVEAVLHELADERGGA
ncbi:MAG TPA: hydrogenase maturation protease [Anaeromyxobacteraceae bacterium]|nr:hydrogenase maturation protease [Anaeromyxobacteraceae bacterium]